MSWRAVCWAQLRAAGSDWVRLADLFNAVEYSIPMHRALRGLVAKGYRDVAETYPVEHGRWLIFTAYISAKMRADIDRRSESGGTPTRKFQRTDWIRLKPNSPRWQVPEEAPEEVTTVATSVVVVPEVEVPEERDPPGVWLPVEPPPALEPPQPSILAVVQEGEANEPPSHSSPPLAVLPALPKGSIAAPLAGGTVCMALPGGLASTPELVPPLKQQFGMFRTNINGKIIHHVVVPQGNAEVRSLSLAKDFEEAWLRFVCYPVNYKTFKTKRWMLKPVRQAFKEGAADLAARILTNAQREGELLGTHDTLTSNIIRMQRVFGVRAAVWVGQHRRNGKWSGLLTEAYVEGCLTMYMFALTNRFDAAIREIGQFAT